MNLKKVLIITLLLLTVLTISSVSANEDLTDVTENVLQEYSSDSIELSDISDDVITSSQDEIVGADNGTFTALKNKIETAEEGTTVNLENNYVYNDDFGTEPITISKQLTINGNGYKIDANSKTAVFSLNAKVILENITFIHCYARYGGAISIWASECAVNSCDFINCSYANEYGYPASNTFGGAIYNIGSSDITSCNFINCSTYNGGAIYNSNQGSTISSCTFTNCHAGNQGGAISTDDGVCNITSCNFTQCSANFQGEAIFNAMNTCNINTCIFTNCTSEYNTKTLYNKGGTAKATKCTFIDIEKNNAYDNVDLVDCTFKKSGEPDPVALTPDDFKVAFTNNDVDIDDEKAVILTFYWPENVDKDGKILLEYNNGYYDDDVSIFFEEGENGTYKNVTFEKLFISEPGTYNINVSYYIDSVFQFKITTGALKITKNYTADDFITVYTYDVYDREEHIVDIWDDETGIGINGTVDIYANNVKVYTRTYAGTDSGKPVAAKDLSGYFNGQYAIKVVYTRADGKVFTKNETVNFIDIVGVQLETTITASSMTVTYNENKNIVATLKDKNGKAISGVEVYVNIMGIKYPLKTDKNGQIKQSIGTLPPTKHTITFTFESTEAYKKSTKSVTVTVKKATPKLTATAKSFKKSVKNKKYTITLKNNLNKVIANAKITLKVKGKTYSAKTTSKGQATFKITNLKKKGTFKATVKYAGDSYYNAKSVTAKITVK